MSFLGGFSSSQFLNLIQGKKLDQELLERLKITLYFIQAVLNDAGHKEINEPAVKNWLDDLRDAVYVADDLLDRVSTKAATQKEASNFLSIYLNLRDRKVANKIKDITRKLEYIVKYKDILGLKEIARENFSWRTPSTSLLEGSNFYGRTQDKEDIIQLLLDDNSEGNISVIPVVGMGGVGKTTLAQSIYNDENLMKKFDLKVWVCVSEEFDIVKVTKTVIEAITSSGCNTKDLNLLQLDLKTKLTGKKFFVGLDDIWNDDYDDHACFLRSNGNPTLEKIGRDIVKKCKGLPLAVQTLGGLLRAKRDIKDWNAVLTSEIWELSANDKGLLEQPKRRKTLEEVGSECFDDLASRLFFKRLEIDDVKSFVMYDLMHDLAISLGGDFYFRSEELGKEDRIHVRTCHLSYGRVVSFCSFEELEVVPDLIGKLIHLRYLDLSETSIKTLPESLSNLYNLQTLKLYRCKMLTMLPSGMQNLVNLQHLNVIGTDLKRMPQGISKLKHLQILSEFVVCEHEENGMRELGELIKLHKSLCIRKLENITSSDEAQDARIMDKIHIEDLFLEWSLGSDLVTTSAHTEKEILDKLQPPKGLKVVGIKRYRGTSFANWVGNSSYHNMTRVSLESCSKCCILPSLGQLPSLKSLEIVNFNVLESIVIKFYKNENDSSSSIAHFSSLEYLSFDKMLCWEVWHSSESYAFHNLRSLE
ncbi:Virus X resistance protein-like, coiled-coil domain [Sesbania bispinosa]|nr:Virus X resistance protein-like, coiled-coil domain [Sesbania bispinosa]